MEQNEFQTLTKDVQEIKEEQRRLRDEQERLRESISGDGNRSPDEEKKNKDQGETKSDSGSEKSAKKESDQNKPDDKKKEDQQPKPPFKERARTYVRTHKKQVVLGAIAFVLLCIAAVLLFLYLRSYESTDDAQVDGHLNAIPARVTGTVLRVYVDDNQTVTAGQLLVELDPRDFQNALDQANANHSAAEAQLKAENPNIPITRTSNESTIANSESAVQSAQAGLIAAQQEYQSRLAMLRQAEANSAKAQQDLERYRGLVQREEISHQQFDTYFTAAKSQSEAVASARAGAEAAQKAINQSQSQLLQAQTRLDEATHNSPRNISVRESGVQARRAALLSTRAQADQAALNLSYTKIFAPVSGIVTSKTVEVGQRIEPGEQLLIVSQTDDIWITANFKETQLRKMHPGQSVDVSVDTFSHKYHGYIESMPGATGSRTSLLPPENATGNFVKVVQRLPVRIRLKNDQDPNHQLRVGMSVATKVWLK